MIGIRKFRRTQVEATLEQDDSDDEVDGDRKDWAQDRVDSQSWSEDSDEKTSRQQQDECRNAEPRGDNLGDCRYAENDRCGQHDLAGIQRRHERTVTPAREAREFLTPLRLTRRCRRRPPN